MQFLLAGVLYIIIDGSSVFLNAATTGQLSTSLSRNERATAQRRTTGVALLDTASFVSLKGAP
jgi:hypothetical protein